MSVDDPDIQSRVLEIVGDNLAQTYISSPAHADRELGIKLPVLGLMVKNLEQYFSLEVMVLDDRGQHRRLRASNFQAVTRRHDDILTMPLRLDPGWNQVQLDLADLLRRAYGTRYAETLRVTIHANCRLRRVYFAERPCNEQALPPEFRLYLPVQAE
ncbi:hypothetical protein H4R35_003080 [Dimargaris xerosporica]|nr:hypothetical protein H4R35_003080 [Dimargaris xerosporica]